MTSTGSLLVFGLGLCLCRRSLCRGGGGREEDGGGVASESERGTVAAEAVLLGRSRLPFLSRSWRHLLKQPVLKVGWELRYPPG